MNWNKFEFAYKKFFYWQDLSEKSNYVAQKSGFSQICKVNNFDENQSTVAQMAERVAMDSITMGLSPCPVFYENMYLSISRIDGCAVATNTA